MKCRYLIWILILSAILIPACSEPVDCSRYSYEDCPKSCWICSSCPECGDVTCQTPEFCQDQGYEKDWYSSE